MGGNWLPSLALFLTSYIIQGKRLVVHYIMLCNHVIVASSLHNIMYFSDATCNKICGGAP